MPVFWLLAALGVGITPYFLPMAAIFALLLAVENALHTRKLLAPCGLFLGTCAAGYAAGVVLGSLNNGYSASRCRPTSWSTSGPPWRRPSGGS